MMAACGQETVRRAYSARSASKADLSVQHENLRA